MTSRLIHREMAPRDDNKVEIAAVLDIDVRTLPSLVRAVVAST